MRDHIQAPDNFPDTGGRRADNSSPAGCGSSGFDANAQSCLASEGGRGRREYLRCGCLERPGQFGQRLLAVDGGQRHLRLEGRAVAAVGSLRHVLSRRGILAALRQNFHLSDCADFPSHLSNILAIEQARM
jgi:hypothetical protein